MQWNELKSHLRHIKASDLKRIQEAFELGKQSHEGQKRKSGEPYFTHCIAVTHMLADMGADADTLIAALLHDTVEDTDLTLKEINKRFGGNVSALIDGVTKLEPEDVAGKPTLDDQIETLRKMFTLLEEDVRVMVIKLVDRLHNMQTIEYLSDSRVKGLSLETKNVYVKIADRLSMQDIRDELEWLSMVHLDPELHETLQGLQMSNERKSKSIITSIQKTLGQECASMEGVRVVYDQKTWDKLRAQHRANNNAITGITDLAVAFVCENIADCYQILGMLHQSWPRETLSFQDFINTPLINGYEGIHTTIILESGLRIRCKIRTNQMHKYAHKGIATLCFDDTAKGTSAYMPSWTKHISTLAKDTAKQSEEFWETLQNDILGESIVLHGSDDRRVIVPNGSTALDGAFYLFGDEALYISSIAVDGKTVPYNTILTNGTSLSIEQSKRKTVQRDWLHHASSGVATAHIRSALSRQSDAKKREYGKELLQQVFVEHKKGYVEEFDTKQWKHMTQAIGYESVNKMYEAIADGHLDPLDAFSMLFEKGSHGQKNTQNDMSTTISFYIEHHETSLEIVLGTCKRYGIGFEDVSYKLKSNNTLSFRIQHRLTPKQQNALKSELETIEAKKIRISIRSPKIIVLTTSVILLWALNPVFAKWLLHEGMTPIALVTIRQLVFFVFTTGLFAVWKYSQESHVGIPKSTRLAMLPAFGMLALSIFTYNALLAVPASVHLMILRLNVFLLPLIYLARRNGYMPRWSFLLACLFGLGVSFRIIPPDYQLLTGIFFSVLSLISYLFYSLITEDTLQQNKIDVRYPALLFQIGLILGGMGLLLIPFQPISILLSPLTLPTIAYVLLCVCLPYACYTAVLKQIQFRNVTHLFLLEVPLAMIFEMIILGKKLPAVTYIVIAGFFLMIGVSEKFLRSLQNLKR